ncbi:hypothetical protein AAHA92_18849 [Salvia divinorum]|uniref:Uncharacterized protein n=1 Tax=Salvia divinorum TaxID=28513 RepID=A0ABD1H3F2_SALDI
MIQELFAKLTRLGSIASDVFVEIEGAQRPLGPLGLQQLYSDMEFVYCYLSQNLHQVMKNVIARAIEVVQANNIDPYSFLPGDEWIADVAQIATKMMLGQASFDNLDRDITSPTASSIHSHGSQ